MTSRIFINTFTRRANLLCKLKVNNSLNRFPTFNVGQNTKLYQGIKTVATINNVQNTITVYDTSSRGLHTKIPKTPDLIYVPHIFRWLKTKFRFKLLQKTWDPDFTEGSFIYGSSKAICKITEIIHENNIEQLKGLLTTAAFNKLKYDMSAKLTNLQKLIIQIKPEDIKILVPMNVTLNKEGLHKNCRIAMRVLALKWIVQNNGSLRLVLVALQTEFLRDYSPSISSDWTISAFDILECTVLTKT